MKIAMEKAIRMYQAAPSDRIAVPMSRTIGYGYYRGTGQLGWSSEVEVLFNNVGEIISAFPKLP